jgi:predicted phage tail protein
MGKLFGDHWTLNAATVQEAMHGIDVQRENKLTKYLTECTEAGIEFYVQKGEEVLGYDNLNMELGKDDLIITPVPAGAGSFGDALKTVIGLVLLYIAFTTPIGNVLLGIEITYKVKIALLLAGSILAQRGITGLMTPKDASEAGDGYFFDGPTNTVKQGIPVPLLYGELIVGGSPMNFSFLEGDMNIGSHSQYFITPASSGGGSSAANSGTAVGGGGVGNNIPGDMTWIQK